MNKYVGAVIAGLAVMLIIVFGIGWLFKSVGEPPPVQAWWAGIFLGLLTAYSMANLAGTRKTATADAAQRAEALAFTAPAGKSAIYVFREGFVGKAAGLDIAIDGKTVAQIKAPRFTRVLVAPGQHTVTAAFGGLAGPQNKAGEIAVDAPDGGCVAVRATLSMGAFQNTIKLEAQDIATAVQRISKIPMTVPDVAEA